ncbi:hypothetical protein [Hymenobacter lucidus]|uniref:DUF2306 domain-containing protein n=1 Tax=Hymenobacter lucidus TaxID=2880930 RepID=A0ABS8AXY6_9BACT|nr:hypothetical protein [Hymenobacter lucidus]MCB2410680.1 hypothetical protein [Hymenobacter lucidus]
MRSPVLFSVAPAGSPAWSTILHFSLLPAAVMVAGAAIAVLKPPGPKLRSAILHFAAGVVFSVVAVELLPDIVRQHAPIEVGVGFALGVAIMLGLRALRVPNTRRMTLTGCTASARSWAVRQKKGWTYSGRTVTGTEHSAKRSIMAANSRLTFVPNF